MHSNTKSLQVVPTVFFDSCRGVFQGGGCRAAALAGAYQAASDAGVHFSEVAGTSAGSILAALIGAGATPDFIIKSVSELDFKKLLISPEQQDGYSSLLAKIAGNLISPMSLISKKAEEWKNLIQYGGFYSSVGIEKWINEKLSELLPNVSNHVTFQDLLIPTYVVGTDLDNSQTKVRSSRETGNTSVAFAVRASCSIPLFFQAVVEGQKRYVDGGVLSNLPSFAFKHQQGASEHFARDRILAFCLEDEYKGVAEWTPTKILKRLIETIVSGATHVQMELHREVHTIKIPTGRIRATDFENITPEDVSDLISNGFNETAEFIKSEATLIHSVSPDVINFYDQDELYAHLVYQAETPAREIIIAENGTRWFWQLFPTVLYWLLSGTRIRVLVGKLPNKEHEQKREVTRRQNMIEMGVEIYENDQLPLTGYLLLRDDSQGSAAIIYSLQSHSYGPLGTLYD